ncbi:zinc-dependent metalloprotease [Nocardioides sp.]|uniref:zinc-dependent metalloprotease n=1 Tax=Nocardioides sp. TaxID=35761 RepID=UPI002ED3F2C3
MSMVDWELAVSIGGRVAGNGPVVTAEEAQGAVDELRAAADRSTGLVREFTGLAAAERTAPVLVVDRQGWVRANTEAFAVMLAPVIDRLQEKKGAPTGMSRAVGARVTGGEVGLLLGVLASKVLGQFDPFHEPAGRLLLVAPNIVHVERELNAVPSDFRLWVALHEETHRVQFTAVPWMREHLFGEIRALADTMDPGSLLEDGLQRITEAVRGGGGSVLDVLSTPEQKEILDRVTGVMSLLEGHADVVMDGVGPTVIPSVGSIRAGFDRRRKGVGVLDRVLRKALGLDVKMAQYRDGAKFVRGVVDKTGMPEFNAVWERPENLPSKAEIADPDSWVARVL